MGQSNVLTHSSEHGAKGIVALPQALANFYNSFRQSQMYPIRAGTVAILHASTVGARPEQFRGQHLECDLGPWYASVTEYRRAACWNRPDKHDR